MPGVQQQCYVLEQSWIGDTEHIGNGATELAAKDEGVL